RSFSLVHAVGGISFLHKKTSLTIKRRLVSSSTYSFLSEAMICCRRALSFASALENAAGVGAASLIDCLCTRPVGGGGGVGLAAFGLRREVGDADVDEGAVADGIGPGFVSCEFTVSRKLDSLSL